MALSPTLRTLITTLTCLLGATGLALLLANTAIFDAIFRWQLVLGPHSASFPMWQKLPEPMTMKAFLFQVILTILILAIPILAILILTILVILTILTILILAIILTIPILAIPIPFAKIQNPSPSLPSLSW